MRTAVESFAECLDELKELLPLHWNRVTSWRKVELNPQYDIFLGCEERGELSFITLRDNGALVGYWIAFVCPSLHYSDILTSNMDAWYLRPDYAGTTAPLRLIRAVEREMKRMGVKYWRAGEKVHAPCGRLFEAVGMTKIESTYSKWIGD